MLQSFAIAEQERISKTSNLAWWFGTHCTKCCDVYPRLIIPDQVSGGCYYMCVVCFKRTAKYSMPHLAELAWNAGDFLDEPAELSFFGGD